MNGLQREHQHVSCTYLAPIPTSAQSSNQLIILASCAINAALTREDDGTGASLDVANSDALNTLQFHHIDISD